MGFQIWDSKGTSPFGGSLRAAPLFFLPPLLMTKDGWGSITFLLSFFSFMFYNNFDYE